MRLTKYWFLEESFNMMRRIGMLNIMKLCDLLEMKIYKKNSVIHESFEDNHLIYFIKKGHVKIGKKVNDEFLLAYSLGKGNIFGESKITTGEASDAYTAIAMSDCTICFIEVDKMQELIEQYPKLNNSIFKIAGLKFHKIERRLTDVLYKDSEIRIKDFIWEFVQENGIEQEQWLIAQNIFTHKDIGQLTSTSRQTVNNVISKLRKTNGLIYDRKAMKIKQEFLTDKPTNS